MSLKPLSSPLSSSLIASGPLLGVIGNVLEAAVATYRLSVCVLDEHKLQGDMIPSRLCLEFRRGRGSETRNFSGIVVLTSDIRYTHSRALLCPD
jgi:hypothetical protein